MAWVYTMPDLVSKRQLDTPSENVPDGVRAATLKAVMTAFVVMTVGILWTEWSSYYFDGSQVTRSYFPMALFFPFLVASMGSMLVNRWRPGYGFSRGELLVVLGMGLVGMTVPYDRIFGGFISH